MNMKRKLIAVIAMVLCVGSLAGCAKQETAAADMDPNMEAMIVNGSGALVQELTGYDEATINTLIEQYEDMDNSAMAGSMESWLTTKEEVGAFVQVDNTSVTFKDKQYVATVEATFEKRPAAVTIYVDKKGTPVSMEFAPYYSLGENMSRAAVHTLIGMGTVFIVLIFISLIIGCFKYINEWEKKAGAKSAPAAPAPAPAPAVAAPVEEEELVDDLELVAVITAAIAASMNTSTDGLVVRSIKRKSGAKWKRA
ncbi:MAG: OadG family transporter subunit [Lachnospiraceae bacterium]|nr:OadG family transporter subunit [Lachnospiraceae bacterium]